MQGGRDCRAVAAVPSVAAAAAGASCGWGLPQRSLAARHVGGVVLLQCSLATGPQGSGARRGESRARAAARRRRGQPGRSGAAGGVGGQARWRCLRWWVVGRVMWARGAGLALAWCAFEAGYYVCQLRAQVIRSKLGSNTKLYRACMTSYDRPECRDG